jgi:hypothetical protein
VAAIGEVVDGMLPPPIASLGVRGIRKAATLVPAGRRPWARMSCAGRRVDELLAEVAAREEAVWMTLDRLAGRP